MIKIFINVPQYSQYQLIAIVAVRNESKNLKGLFKNINNEVDGIIILNDGSVDDTAEIVSKNKKVLKVITNPIRASEDYHVGKNLEKLIKEAKKFNPEWIFLIDPDERVENNFRKKFERIKDMHPEKKGFIFKFRELWDNKDTFRSDGVWGEKHKFSIFRNAPLQVFNFRKHHNLLFPLGIIGNLKRTIILDTNIYHLKMIEKKERIKRKNKFNKLDPDSKYQTIGYDYLVDEKGIKLEKIPKGKEYYD